MRIDARILGALFGVAAALAQSPGYAQSTVEARSTTAVISRPTVVDGQVESIVPVYELVWVRGRQAEAGFVHDVEAVVSGWGSVSPVNPFNDEIFTADLDLAYIEGNAWDQRVTARVGRQNVVGGAARWLQLDGGRVDVVLTGPMTLTVYGGAPVTPRFGTELGDAVAGARLFWRHNWRSELGASVIHVLDDGLTARQDIGFDARYALGPKFSLSTNASLSTWEQRLAEAKASAAWIPSEVVAVRVDARRVAPDLMLSRASVLSVFAGEPRDEAGANTAVAPLRWLEFDAHYHAILRGGDFGQRAGGGATIFNPSARQTRVGISGERLYLAEDGYVRARLALGRVWWNRRVSTSIDLDAFLLDVPVQDTRTSAAASAHIGWRIEQHWRVVVGGLVASSTTFERRAEGTLRLVYEPELIFVGGKP